MPARSSALGKEGLTSIAVYSDADRDAPHVLLADVAVRIGPAAVGESYLNIDALLAAALEVGQAVHHSYGFLSKRMPTLLNGSRAGLIWIGPPPSAITQWETKQKQAIFKKQCPNGGWIYGDQSDEALLKAAEDIGYFSSKPLPVEKSEDSTGQIHQRFLPALQSARSGSGNAFGDSTVVAMGITKTGMSESKSWLTSTVTLCISLKEIAPPSAAA